MAYYPFNGNANDASGNGNHGIVSGPTLTADRYGNLNSAYNFGGYTNSSIIRIPNNISLQFVNSFTVSLWYNLNTYAGMDGWGSNVSNGYHMLFAKEADWGGIYCGVSSNTAYDSVYYNLTNNVSYGNTNFNGNKAVKGLAANLNTWVHMTYVVSSGNMQIYRNGSLILNKQITSNLDFTTTNNRDLFFGRFSQYWYPLNGKLDDIRVYARALNSAEVANIYNSESGGISLISSIRFGGGLSTLRVGTGYNFTASIKNNDPTSWVGNIYYKVNSGTPVLISSNVVVGAGGTYNVNTNFSPQTAQIGQNVNIELLTKQGSNDFVRVGTVNGTLNPVKIDIEGASTNPVAKLPFIRLNQSEASPGGNIQIIGGNFEPNTNVTIGSSPSISGASYPVVTTAADGSINASFVIPVNVSNKYLTFIAYDTKRNNPTSALKISLPTEAAALSITSYIPNQNFYITPNGSIPITINDRLLKAPSYPLTESSRSYKYIISFRGVSSTTPSTWTMTTEERKGLVNSSVSSTYYFPFTDPEFNGPHPSGSPRQLIMIVKDFYNQSRVVESIPINIIVENEQYGVSKVWDKSWNNYNIPVNGVAADGISRIFLKVKKLTSNTVNIQSVSVNLTSSENSNDPRWLGRVMYSSNQNLSNPNFENFSNGSYTLEANDINTISAQSLSTNANNEYWFWYIAPDDFETSLIAANGFRKQKRWVAANVTLNLSNGTTETIPHNIEIVRPPLMLVHGWMGDNTSFRKMAGDSRFKDNWIKIHKNSMNPYSTFDENSRILLGNELRESSFQYVIDSMRHLGYASNQVDYVCHSMGGLMLRNILSKKDDNHMETEFFQTNSSINYSNRNYQKGWVHKYITINTPHFGSPGADLIAGALPLAGTVFTETLRGLERTFVSKDIDGNENFKPAVATYDKNLNRYVPSDAVKNMQTNSSTGGKTNFKPLTNVRSHVIVTDIDEGFGESNPTIPDYSTNGFYNQLFSGIKEEYEIKLPLQIIGNVVFALAKDITKFNVNNDNTVFGQFISANKTQLYSIWKPYLDDIEIPYVPDLPTYIRLLAKV